MPPMAANATINTSGIAYLCAANFVAHEGLFLEEEARLALVGTFFAVAIIGPFRLSFGRSIHLGVLKVQANLKLACGERTGYLML